MTAQQLQHPTNSSIAVAGIDGEPDTTLLVEGLLVGGDGEQLDIVVTPYLFSLERGAVLDIEALPEPPQLIPGMASAVRLRIRAGACLFGLSSSAEMEAKMWRRRSSFAVATRSAAPEQTRQSEHQRAATRAFLARHGIEAEDLDRV
jgi:hypothetical protein